MQIIPVIDLKGGLAVHAREGRREHYRPLVSTLCADPDPHAVVRGLLQLHPFSCLYLADLDALMGHAPQTAVQASLIRDFPELEFWIDQGGASVQDSLSAKRYFSPVIGSESLKDDNLSILSASQANCILSLDFSGSGLLGSRQVLAHPEFWPERIILMSLAHVGSTHGPDFDRISHYLAHYPQHRFIAAGGVRHADDLRQLAGLGVSGVLMASALHDGQVDGAIIREVSGGGD